MIAHIVLFKPRPDAGPEDRRAFAEALERACREIASVRRFHVGRRVRHGRAYERAMHEDYSYAAVVEFESLEGLADYLNHPAHDTLGRLWATASEATLVYDYDMRDAAAGMAP